MEVKKAGKYKTKGGETVEIYGFSDARETGEPLAEGFFETSRGMGWWNPHTGVYSWGKTPDPSKDIVDCV